MQYNCKTFIQILLYTICFKTPGARMHQFLLSPFNKYYLENTILLLRSKKVHLKISDLDFFHLIIFFFNYSTPEDNLSHLIVMSFYIN